MPKYSVLGKMAVGRSGLTHRGVKNKILELPENGVENNRIGGEYVWDASKNNIPGKVALQEGGTMGDMFDINNWVYSTDEEAAKAPQDMLITIEDRTKFGGDVNWLDADGDGKIDSGKTGYI